jgi:hypothetical protein
MVGLEALRLDKGPAAVAMASASMTTGTKVTRSIISRIFGVGGSSESERALMQVKYPDSRAYKDVVLRWVEVCSRMIAQQPALNSQR